MSDDELILDRLAHSMMTIELESRPNKTLDQAMRVPSEIERTYRRLIDSGEATKMLEALGMNGLMLVVIREAPPEAK